MFVAGAAPAMSFVVDFSSNILVVFLDRMLRLLALHLKKEIREAVFSSAVLGDFETVTV